MSIWSTPLFGKRDESPPASPIAIRHARLLAANSLDVVPWVVLAGLLGELLFSGELLLFMLIGAPKSLPTAQARDAVFDGLTKNISVPLIAVTLGFLGVFIFTVRPVARLFFDRAASRMTQATRHNHRRKRRQARRIGIVTCAVFLAMLACGALFMPAMASLVMLAKATAPTGMISIALGWNARKGARLTCGRCGYAMGSWRGSADRCPECNEAWHEPWKARLGPRL